MYLGANICKFIITDREKQTQCWAMSADSHVQKALEVVEQRLKDDNVMFRLSNRTAEHPFSTQSY